LGNRSSFLKVHAPTDDRPESRADLTKSNGFKEENRKGMEKVFQEKGLHPQLLYNPVSGSFAYRFKCSEESIRMVRPKSRADLEKHKDTRSKSADFTKGNKDGPKRLSVPLTLPKNILSLGFRRPSKKSTRRETKSAYRVSDKQRRHYVPEQETETPLDSATEIDTHKVYRKKSANSKTPKHRKSEYERFGISFAYIHVYTVV
jgi:hypothetical protein